MKTTIDPNGCIHLDTQVQAKLGVQPGDEVILETRGNECVLKSARPRVGLSREGNVLVHFGVNANEGETAVESLREERCPAGLHISPQDMGFVKWLLTNLGG